MEFLSSLFIFRSCVLCGRFDRVVVIESGGATMMTTVDSVGEMMTNTHSEAESCRTGNWQTAIDLQVSENVVVQMGHCIHL